MAGRSPPLLKRENTSTPSGWTAFFPATAMLVIPTVCFIISRSKNTTFFAVFPHPHPGRVCFPIVFFHLGLLKAALTKSSWISIREDIMAARNSEYLTSSWLLASKAAKIFRVSLGILVWWGRVVVGIPLRNSLT